MPISGGPFPVLKLTLAQTTIFCAIDETLDGITGRYYADCQESKLLNPKAENDELAKKLWEKSAEIVQI